MTELSIVIPARGQKVAILCGKKNISLYTLLNGPIQSWTRLIILVHVQVGKIEKPL